MKGDFDSTTKENGNSPPSEWFDDNVAMGYVYPNATKTDCKDVAAEALNLWGWSNADFLTAIGYSYKVDTADGTAGYHGTSDGATRIKNFQQAVQSKIYGGSAPSLSNAANYVIALNAFTLNGGACVATDLGSYTSLNATQKKFVDANSQTDASAVKALPVGTSGTAQYVKLTVDDSTTGAETDHGYIYLVSTSTPHTGQVGGVTANLASQLTYGYHTTAKQPSCSSLASTINKYADAYNAWFASNTGKGDTGAQGIGCTQNANSASCPPSSTQTSCNITQLGWILCPILSVGAQLADGAYGFVANNFLQTDPSLVNTDPNATTTATNADGSTTQVKVGTGTYNAWKIMQAIANVCFVIVFLFIIFSQLTSVGVSNYGVKKTLPRLIVAAVLVNVSFWICAIAVDLSNILGYSLKDLLSAVANQVVSSGGGTAVSTTDQSSNLAGIVGTIITATMLVWLNLSAVLVAMVGVVITLLVIFVILIARKVLIVLLIVLAPLAFVAYLLPNTESLFKKWRRLFTQLLLLFPIIGLLYGGGLLASEILRQVAGTNVVMQIAAYVALVIPLLASIPLLKGAVDGVGKLGGAIQSFGNRANKAAGAKADKTFQNSRLGQYKQYRSGRWAQRRAAIQGGTYQGKGGKANPLNWITGANRAVNERTGRFGAKLASAGAGVAGKEDAELMGNAGARLESMNFDGRPLSQKQMIQIARGHDVTSDGTANGSVVASARSFDEYSRRAAIEKAGKNATVEQAHELVDASSGMSLAERKALASSLAGSNVASKASYLGGRTLEEIAQGTANSDAAARNAILGGKITAEALAAGDKDSVGKLVDVAASTPGGSAERTALAAAYGELNRPDSHLRERIAPGGDHDLALQRIATLGPSHVAPAASDPGSSRGPAGPVGSEWVNQDKK